MEMRLSFRVSSSLFCDNQVEFAQKKLMAEAVTLLSEQSDIAVMGGSAGADAGDDIEIKSIPASDDEDSMSVVSVDSLVCDGSSVASVAEELMASIDGYDIGTLNLVDEEVKNIVGCSSLAIDQKVPTILDGTIQGIRSSVFLKEYVPLWGTTSICGRRPEMEDALAVVPWFHEIPVQMLIGDILLDGMDSNLSRLPAHFFGVYDGHGGAQVANYCQNHLHLALIDEIRNLNDGMVCTNGCDLKNQWERAFTGCFQKVDDEVGGKESSTSGVPSEPIAPETVGSTAVVAVISSSHIIVANCGDSRAVLYRGKQCIPLSEDHKPNRDDEYERIEASGGKVIQWNGYRVFGVLAMSRAIALIGAMETASGYWKNEPCPAGDRYLKPSIIAEPEVKIITRAREDECLVLASDGLWDVMSNEEACDVARKRILMWHKKNGMSSSSTQRGETPDPAARSAAEYLAKLALQKGSKDNITIIVIDLKAQRKFKSKTNSAN